MEEIPKGVHTLSSHCRLTDMQRTAGNSSTHNRTQYRKPSPSQAHFSLPMSGADLGQTWLMCPQLPGGFLVRWQRRSLSTPHRASILMHFSYSWHLTVLYNQNNADDVCRSAARGQFIIIRRQWKWQKLKIGTYLVRVGICIAYLYHNCTGFTITGKAPVSTLLDFRSALDMSGLMLLCARWQHYLAIHDQTTFKWSAYPT